MLKQRIITAVVAFAVVVLILFSGSSARMWLGVVVMLRVSWEVTAMVPFLSLRHRLSQLLITALPGLAVFTHMPSTILAVFLGSIVLYWTLEIVKIERDKHMQFDPKRLFPLALNLSYVMPLGLCMIWSLGSRQVGELLWVLLTVIAADTGAFFAGKYFGGAKLSPRVSPNKTWAGALAGVFAAILVALLGAVGGLAQLELHLALILGLITGVLAVIGDLVESLIKRAFDIKDFGTILPGHGGLFDRVDGLYAASLVLLLLP
jgi:phosphatidate cytidylyltransferase